MKKWIAVALLIAALLFGAFYNYSTVTPLDRPWLLSGKKEVITVVHVTWMCNCADFVEATNYTSNYIASLEDDDYFFIEAAAPDLQASTDSVSYRYVRLTGSFYLDKGIPAEYALGQMEDKPDHARVFGYDKMEYLEELSAK